MTAKELIDKLTEMVENDEIWSKSKVFLGNERYDELLEADRIFYNSLGMLVISGDGETI